MALDDITFGSGIFDREFLVEVPTGLLYAPIDISFLGIKCFQTETKLSREKIYITLTS